MALLALFLERDPMLSHCYFLFFLALLEYNTPLSLSSLGEHERLPSSLYFRKGLSWSRIGCCAEQLQDQGFFLRAGRLLHYLRALSTFQS